LNQYSHNHNFNSCSFYFRFCI